MAYGSCLMSLPLLLSQCGAEQLWNLDPTKLLSWCDWICPRWEAFVLPELPPFMITRAFPSPANACGKSVRLSKCIQHDGSSSETSYNDIKSVIMEIYNKQ